MIYKFQVLQQDPQVAWLRAIKEDRSLIAADDVASMKLFVTDMGTGEPITPLGGLILDKTDCILPKTEWKTDDEGYNVRVPVSGEYLPNHGKTYRVEVKITPDEGEAYYLDAIEYETTRTYSAE